MTKKLFVGGLSWGTSDEQFRAAFEEFGTVTEARIILDQETGRSRGFGFVTFDDDEAANRAIVEMDGSELGGRTIRVNEAQERAPRPAPSRDSRPQSTPSDGGRPSRTTGGRSSFRSDDRPSAGRGPKRRGRGGDEGWRDDRFSRRRNSHQGRRERGGSSDDGGYDSYDE